MELKHGIVLHLVNMVARQDENVFGVVTVDKIQILIDGVGGTRIPVGFLLALIRRKNFYAAVGAV